MLLFGQQGITVLQDLSQDAFGGLDLHMPHVDGDPAHLVAIRPAGFISVIGQKLHVSSPGLFDDVPALLFRWCERPEGHQVEVGKAVGIPPRDRPFYGHGCHLRVGAIVWCKLLRQGKSPCTGFIHYKTSSLPSSFDRKRISPISSSPMPATRRVLPKQSRTNQRGAGVLRHSLAHLWTEGGSAARKIFSFFFHCTTTVRFIPEWMVQ